MYTAVFFRKYVYEILKRNSNMFVDLQGYCDQNKNKSQEKTEYCIKVWLVLASTSAKDLKKKIIFLPPFYKNIFGGF